jgi:dolichol-phosphate mannosyltransferase
LANNNLIVIPTYNEAGSITRTVETIFRCEVPSLGILIVDDQSPDGTGDIADVLSVQYPGRVTVCHRNGERGLGNAYKAGFLQALAMDAEVIVQMDADGSHAPEYLPGMLDQIKRFDVVIGSRYSSGGGVDPQWGLGRRILSRVANLYSRLVLGATIRDMTGGYKCFSRYALEKIAPESLASRGYIFQVEVNHILYKLGLKVIEVPIIFRPRLTGVSKMSLGVALEGLVRVWRLRSKYGSDRRRSSNILTQRGPHEKD